MVVASLLNIAMSEIQFDVIADVPEQSFAEIAESFYKEYLEEKKLAAASESSDALMESVVAHVLDSGPVLQRPATIHQKWRNSDLESVQCSKRKLGLVIKLMDELMNPLCCKSDRVAKAARLSKDVYPKRKYVKSKYNKKSPA